tara:strand:- start:80 stop:493 length:414 start_codon:yes stop_codon:yes gene_type:complete
LNTSIQTDILIIDSGLSGSVAAIVAADEGQNVLIITKPSELKSGNTPWAQGKIVYTSQLDSPDKLKTDITQADDHHSWDEAVKLICNEGPPMGKNILLDRLHVPFYTNIANTEPDKLSRTIEALESLGTHYLLEETE